MKVGADDRRQSLYAEVTQRVIAELEEARLPWVQPWDASSCECGMPRNGSTGRAYSGINILILWAAVIRQGHGSQRWLTYRQAQAAGGTVRRGEKGVAVCYADRFTPKSEQERASDEQRDARQVAFLKRFTVFNVDQCDGLPEAMTIALVPLETRDIMPRAEELIAATGADFRIGGATAYYSPGCDYVQVPPRQAFADQINWYRTALHELGHWTGHPTRLGRDQSGAFRSETYAREELVAEMASAFTCASLSIQPTVRHADYIGSWLAVLREDDHAIFRAASAASKAANFLLGSTPSDQPAEE
jgi:antirestriction protein ArdC